MNDEIIAEIRATKEALAEASGYDIRRIAEEVRKSEIQSGAEGWIHITAPLVSMLNSAFKRTRFVRHVHQ